MALSGLPRAPTFPSTNSISSAGTLSLPAALRASRSRSRSAARCTVPATAGAKRLEKLPDAIDQASRAVTLVERLLDRAGIIARIEQAAGRGAVGERIGGNEVATDDVEGIAPQLDRDALHEPLERVIDLRSAEAAVEAARRLVGEYHPVAHGDVTNVVGAGEVAVHAVERRRLGRAQVRTHVLDLVPVERADAPVGLDRGGEPRDAVGGGDGANEMLEPVLDPLDRPAAHARGDADQHHVRHEALLHAEAAACVRRDA